MKKLPVLLALSVISAALLAGCGGSGKTDSTELRYASMKDIRNINPHLYLGVNSYDKASRSSLDNKS